MQFHKSKLIDLGERERDWSLVDEKPRKIVQWIVTLVN
jgi:hypothetical protein